MVKIISRGSYKRDDPIFSGGLETFTIRKPTKEKPKDAVKPEAEKAHREKTNG